VVSGSHNPDSRMGVSEADASVLTSRPKAAALEFCVTLRKYGIARAANSPTTATTIRSSTRVKPLLDRFSFRVADFISILFGFARERDLQTVFLVFVQLVSLTEGNPWRIRKISQDLRINALTG